MTTAELVDVVPGEAVAAVYGDPSADLCRHADRVEPAEPIGAGWLREFAAGLAVSK